MSHRTALMQGWGRRRGRLPWPPTDPQPGDLGRSAYRRLRREVVALWFRHLETERRPGADGSRPAGRRIEAVVDQALRGPGMPRLAPAERLRLVRDVEAEIRGFGPLQPLLDDPSVSDVLVNGPDEVWVDRHGRLERTGVRFDDREHLERLLGRQVRSRGRNLDEGSPTVDLRLEDGSRLHAVLPPLAPAPTVSIRRRRTLPLSLADLRAAGSLDGRIARCLETGVRHGLAIVVSGGAASGKTTLLNVLSRFVPADERVITIEETAELALDHPHVVALEARPANVEGRGEVDLRDLVRNALRMRPDRIIVGEVRGPEVFDMLQALNTGHRGSLTTVHANGPEDALRRLENLVHLTGFALPSRAIRELLGAAIDLLVHVARFPDGTRRVVGVHEVLLDDAGLSTRAIFAYRNAGESSGHEATGERPSFAAALGLPADLFHSPAGPVAGPSEP